MFYASIPCEDRISPQDERRAEMLKVLNLESEDGLDEKKINKTYRKLAMKHHPDRGGDEKDFIKIKTAHDFLTAKNEEERNKICPPPNGIDEGADFFEHFFSDIVYRNLRENIREFFVIDWDEDSGDEEFLPQHGIFSRQQGSFCIRHRKQNGRTATNSSSRRRMQRKRSHRSKRASKKEEKKGKVVDEEEERLNEAKAKVPRMPMKMKPPKVKKVFERSADISWSEPQVVDDEDTEDKLEYFLELKIGEGYKFKPVYRGSELEYKITRLVPGNEYSVRIRCVNKYGTNEWSESSFTTEGELSLDGGLDGHPEVWSEKKIQQEKRRVKKQRKKERKRQRAKQAREQAEAQRKLEEEKKKRNLEKQREDNRRHREEQMRKMELEKKKLQEQLWRRFTSVEEKKKKSEEGETFNLENVDRKVQCRLWEQMSKRSSSPSAAEKKNKAKSHPAKKIIKSSRRSTEPPEGSQVEKKDELKVPTSKGSSVGKPDMKSQLHHGAVKPKPVGSRPAVVHRSQQRPVQDQLVSCPICEDQISYLKSEEHIDLCLAKTASIEPKERSVDYPNSLQHSQNSDEAAVSMSPHDYVPDVDGFEEQAPNCLPSRLQPTTVINEVNKVIYAEQLQGRPSHQPRSSPIHQPWDSGPRFHSPLNYHAEHKPSPRSTESMCSRKQHQPYPSTNWCDDEHSSSLHSLNRSQRTSLSSESIDSQNPRHQASLLAESIRTQDSSQQSRQLQESLLSQNTQFPRRSAESGHQYSPPELKESWRNEDQYRTSQALRLGKFGDEESRDIISAPMERILPEQSIFLRREQPVQRSSELYGFENRYGTNDLSQHHRNPGDVFFDSTPRHPNHSRTVDYSNSYPEVDGYHPVRSLNGDPPNLQNPGRSQKGELTGLHHSLIREANSSNQPQPVRSLNGDPPNLYHPVRGGLHCDSPLDFQRSRQSVRHNSLDPSNLHQVRSLKVDVRNMQQPVRSLNGDLPHLQPPLGSLNADPPNLQRSGRRRLSNDNPPNLYRDNSLQRSASNLHQPAPTRRQYHIGNHHPVSRVQEPRLQQRYPYSQHQYYEDSSSTQRPQPRQSPSETLHYLHNRPHRKEIGPLMRISEERNLQGGGGRFWDFNLPDPNDYVAASR